MPHSCLHSQYDTTSSSWSAQMNFVFFLLSQPRKSLLLAVNTHLSCVKVTPWTDFHLLIRLSARKESLFSRMFIYEGKGKSGGVIRLPYIKSLTLL